MIPAGSIISANANNNRCVMVLCPDLYNCPLSVIEFIDQYKRGVTLRTKLSFGPIAGDRQSTLHVLDSVRQPGASSFQHQWFQQEQAAGGRAGDADENGQVVNCAGVDRAVDDGGSGTDDVL